MPTASALAPTEGAPSGRGQEKSVLKMLLHFFLFTCILFLMLLLLASVWFFSLQKKTANDYLESSMSAMADNIESYFGTLEKIGFGISSNRSVINLYSSDRSMDIDDAVGSFQTMTLLCSIEPSIADIMIVDINGTGKSYFAGIDYGIIEEIPLYESFYDSHILERSLKFFPPESKWSDVYFVYIVPILHLDVWPEDSQKVATGLLLCTKTRLASLMKAGSAQMNEEYALYQGDACVLSSSGTPPEPGPNTITKEVALSRGGLTLKGMATPRHLSENTHLLLLFGVACFGAVALVLFLLAKQLRRYILNPIYNTTVQLVDYRGENLSAHITYSGIKEIDTIIADINQMIDKIKMATRQILSTQNMLYETELRTKEAQLYALQSQVNPHFLYNTLQCICGLAAMGRTADIQKITLAMSDVFRYSIHPGNFIGCAEEIEIIYQYLSIFEIRYDGKISYEIQIDEDVLDCRILKMIIQPTVENALLHAYQDTDEEPFIQICGEKEGHGLVFTIADRGSGISQDKLLELQKQLERDFSESIQKASSFGLGLYNINRRIKLAYGDRYGISITSSPEGTQVKIRVPDTPPGPPQ